MTRILAVGLLLLSFASAAFADGSGLPPFRSAAKQIKLGVVLLADGSGLPPTGNVAKPLAGKIAA
jgi:hypothetical protein